MDRKWILVSQWGFYAGSPPEGYARWTQLVSMIELFDTKEKAVSVAQRWAPGLVMVSPVCPGDLVK
jgi:hypothetical protein